MKIEFTSNKLPQAINLKAISAHPDFRLMRHTPNAWDLHYDKLLDFNANLAYGIIAASVVHKIVHPPTFEQTHALWLSATIGTIANFANLHTLHMTYRDQTPYYQLKPTTVWRHPLELDNFILNRPIDQPSPYKLSISSTPSRPTFFHCVP